MKETISIFLVDDDKLFIFLTKKTINATKLVSEIKEFNDGEQAIDYLKQISDTSHLLPDVIFLDLSMPIMDGWGFLEEYIKLEPKVGKKIKVYILSSSISPHDVERSRHISAVSDFLVKPLMKEQFVELFNSLSL